LDKEKRAPSEEPVTIEAGTHTLEKKNPAAPAKFLRTISTAVVSMVEF
jgi:hypothetical protein